MAQLLFVMFVNSPAELDRDASKTVAVPAIARDTANQNASILLILLDKAPRSFWVLMVSVCNHDEC